MLNPIILEEKYNEFMQDLQDAAPDGVVDVDLALLHSYGLLEEDEELATSGHPLTHYFHVIETAEKITLFNDQFVVWIVPQVMDQEPITFTLVALLTPDEPHLEVVFCTNGVYNTSRTVLGVLEHLLEEIRENEDLLARLSN